uniref:Uncharacterized protein n=1 Tax=Aegilops tauschii subsp. strangulata TaxID=200361 RepID=A0A453S8S4_AEGTS
ICSTVSRISTMVYIVKKKKIYHGIDLVLTWSRLLEYLPYLTLYSKFLYTNSVEKMKRGFGMRPPRTIH